MNIEQLFSLQGKTALVSGASSGLGEYFATLLAQAGAEVIVAARRKERLDSVVEEIKKNGGKAYSVSMDVCSKESVEEAFQTIDGLVDGLDIVINNAGISSAPSKFINQEDDDWEYLLDVNLKGAWRVAKAAAKRMEASKSGCIVNTGSIYSLCTGIMKADYNVSKVAIAQLTKNMALELSRSGVRVNALCPGYFASAINESEFSSEKGQQYISRLVPQRLGSYEELAGPLLLLVSNAGSFVNGISLPVDGGSLLSPI